MASGNFYTIITTIGQAKIANAISFGTKVEFSKMKIGDSNGAYYDPTENQTELVHEVYEIGINQITVDKDNPNWIHIEAIIPSTVGGFYIREYGVYDTDGDLIAICKCAETYKPIISDGSTKELILDMVIAVVNTDVIELKVDPSIIFASKTDITELRTYVENQIANINTKVDGEKIEIVTAGGTNNYTATVTSIKTLTTGTKFILLTKTNSSANSTLNINGLGQKEIRDIYLNNFSTLKANVPYFVIYNGTYFIIQGSTADAVVAQTTANNALNKATTVENTVNGFARTYTGSGEPNNSIGKNGDIYIKY